MVSSRLPLLSQERQIPTKGRQLNRQKLPSRHYYHAGIGCTRPEPRNRPPRYFRSKSQYLSTKARTAKAHALKLRSQSFPSSCDDRRRWLEQVWCRDGVRISSRLGKMTVRHVSRLQAAITGSNASGTLAACSTCLAPTSRHSLGMLRRRISAPQRQTPAKRNQTEGPSYFHTQLAQQFRPPSLKSLQL